MNLSRAKPESTGESSDQRIVSADKKSKKDFPKLETFLEVRDYAGAITLLEFQKAANSKLAGKNDLWLAYCMFHLGDYKRACELYETMTAGGSTPNQSETWLNLACCYFYLGRYNEVDDALRKSPDCKLKTRLLFHLSHKFNDEVKLLEYHKQLNDVIEDQLSLASMHYMRGHYQEALEIYKTLLMQNRELLAMNVYMALCYYKLDFYDISQEVLQSYLQKHSDSPIAYNLKACNHFKLYNGRAAEAELKVIQEQTGTTNSLVFAKDLIKHNLVVFRDGENAMQVLPPLVDVVPEARLNLVVHLLKQDEPDEAHSLIADLEPTVPCEYIIKAVAMATLGYEQNSKELLEDAQKYFQLIGSSASECDTIPGRQCMAAYYFLMQNYDDVLLYLNSIKSYFYNDDAFNFNYAQAKAATGQFKDAEEILLLIQDDKIRQDGTFLCWLSRCFITNRKPRLAWELYIRLETSPESFSVLTLIANDCYKTGQFYYSARAFDILERMEPTPEHWEGKRGACAGTFQQVIAGKESKGCLSDILQILLNSSNPQAEFISSVIKKWAMDNSVTLG